jgi:acyl-CoA thioesterase-2
MSWNAAGLAPRVLAKEKVQDGRRPCRPRTVQYRLDGPVTAKLADLLTLERIERDLYRAPVTADEHGWLYGGQVAAQALAAAGDTVDPERVPHSLHGYFLRGGDAARPTVLQVERDRDGGSFSARRVVVLQNGEVIFSMAASFHRPGPGIDRQAEPMPATAHPDDLEPFELPLVVSMEARLPEQPFGAAALPTRFWARYNEKLPDEPLTHACVLTYLSDMSTGLAALHDGPWVPSPSVDHAVWFHRQIRLDEWVLMNVVPHSTAGGRGWYTGTIHTVDGVLGASLAQEALFGRRQT